METICTRTVCIRNANEEDIKEIENVYKQRVLFNDAHDIHQWEMQDVRWEELSKLYTIDHCFVGIYDTKIACVMMIVDEDKCYWPLAPKGEALYLHKICVHPEFRGMGFANQLISYFKEKGKREGYASVRLDVREHKKKLREMYEHNGFLLVRIIQVHETFKTALYVYDETFVYPTHNHNLSENKV